MKQNSCKVSIIVPVYNAEQYLDNCINSLLKQSLGEIEIILVNDGSQDSSACICDEYAKKDYRVKVLHLANGGPARARNHGINIAKGKYLGFVDADDFVEDTMFEVLFKKAEKEQTDLIMCNYYLDSCGVQTPVMLRCQKKYEGKDEIKEKLLYRYYKNDNDNVGLYSLWNKLFLREMIEEHQIKIDEKLMRAEDAWFVFDCLKVAQKVVFVPECLYYYLQNPNSIMHTISLNQYEKWVDTKKRLLIENEKLKFELDYNEFYASFLGNVVVYCRTLIEMDEIENAKKILQDAFFLKAARFDKKLPIHIKVINRLARYHMVGIAIFVLKLWKFVTSFITF